MVEAALAELDPTTVHRLRSRKHPRGAIPHFHTSPPVNGSNVARLAADLVRRARNRTLFYHTSGSEQRPTVMIMWGGDWTFSEDAGIEFRNMDQIVQYVNTHSADLNATLRYGILDGYLDAVHRGTVGPNQSTPVLPVVEGDFFVMDEECCQKSPVNKVWNCWSGYFSSFPALKRGVRKLAHKLREAELFSLLATQSGAGDGRVRGWEAALAWGRHTSAILQHHDAVTGTGGGSCNQEYHAMLHNATALALAVTANSTATLAGIEPLALRPYDGEIILPEGDTPWEAPGAVVDIPDNGSWVPLVVTNALGWSRVETVTVRVRSTSPHLELRYMQSVNATVGAPVLGQLAPPTPWNASLTGYGGHVQRHERWASWASDNSPGTEAAPVLSRLIFAAQLPPVGAALFAVRARQDSNASSATVAISAVHVGNGTESFRLRTTTLDAQVSPRGLLESVVVATANITQEHDHLGHCAPVQMRQDFMLYWGNGGRSGPGSNPDGSGGDGGSESDAYVFAPQGAAASLARRDGVGPGFWPSGQPKPPYAGAVVHITGPVVQEVSSVYGLQSVPGHASKTPLVWQALRTHSTLNHTAVAHYMNADDYSEAAATRAMVIDTEYLVEPLASNQDLIVRFNTDIAAAGLVHVDEGGWTDAVHANKEDFFSAQSKIGCNLHPSSSYAELRALAADASLAVITDRPRGVASLSDGQLELILHRHATGGDGRGPSDGDSSTARGTLFLLPASGTRSFATAQRLRPVLALRSNHPASVLVGLPLPPTASVRLSGADGAQAWSGLRAPLPATLHIFTFARRAFLRGGGATPDYPRGESRQGALRLQNLAAPIRGGCTRNTKAACSKEAEVVVDLAAIFRPGLGPRQDGTIEERTLSLARRPRDVVRRSWRGAGKTGVMRTSAGWAHDDVLGVGNTTVALGPMRLRSFVFSL